MTATVSRSPGEGGVLFTTGTQNAGYVMFVLGDRLCFDYNAFGDHTLIESDVTIPADARELTVRFERIGRAGRIEIRIDGLPCGAADVPYAMRMMSSIGASIGSGTHSPVSTAYTGPFPFEGTLHEVTVDVDPSRSETERRAEAEARLAAEMTKQ